MTQSGRPEGGGTRRPRPRKRFGQHFLEPVWAAKVVEAIAPEPGDRFIEIGPGRGAITLPLAATGVRLRAIEIDRDLAAALEPQLPSTATVRQADFLALTPDELFGDDPGFWRAVGNLPYNLSTPILIRLHDLARTTGRLKDATLMLQREVADRVLAGPGTGEYGPLAILLGLYADRERLLSLPPGAFRPAPEVHSSVVRLVFRPPSVSVGDYLTLERLVRTVFQQRRKTLANALRPLLARAGVDAGALASAAGVDPGQRPEMLSAAAFVRLADALASR
ncbi:MAG TPA: 16S rRNA (adenine(1518)-N(6)/adenine(1519)-N(6))-dimethyltransferase RsmA [Vicinamibacterales bacterium]